MRERIDLGLKNLSLELLFFHQTTFANMASTYQKKVMEYSPIIASKLAMSTTLMTPGEIAKELRQLLDNNAQNNNDF